MANVNKIYYRVTKIEDIINIIIPHFNTFPLLSRKQVNFKVWSSAMQIYKLGNHKTIEGFSDILSLYLAISKRPSSIVKSHFPGLKPSLLPEYKISNVELKPFWVTGYLTLYFNLQLTVLAEGWKTDIYNKLRHSFSFSRDISEISICRLLAEFLGGNLYIRRDKSRVDVDIVSLESCENLVKFFNDYPIQSIRLQEYLIWQEFILNARQFRNSNKTIFGNLDQNLSIFFKLIKKLEEIRA